MIIDVHSHAWQYPDHFSDDFRDQAKRARAGVEVDLTVRYDEYAAAGAQVDRTIVFGGKARRSGLWVDDRYVADYVAAHSDKLIGFQSLDPTQDGWQREMHAGHQDLGLGEELRRGTQERFEDFGECHQRDPEIPPSLRTRQKCTAINVIAMTGTNTQCST